MSRLQLRRILRENVALKTRVHFSHRQVGYAVAVFDLDVWTREIKAGAGTAELCQTGWIPVYRRPIIGQADECPTHRLGSASQASPFIAGAVDGPWGNKGNCENHKDRNMPRLFAG